MPAAPPSLIDAVSGRSTVCDPGRLREVLAGVPDPRKKRCVRYSVAAILAVAAAAVATGCRFYVAIGEWSAEARRPVLAALEVTSPAPSEKTIRALLNRLDARTLSTIMGGGCGHAPAGAGPPGRGR